MKPQLNRQRYLEVLRSMTPEQKLLKAFELSESSKARFLERLRLRFPDATEDEIRRILIDRQMKKSQSELRTYMSLGWARGLRPS
jgi:hypothetical protein